MSTPTGDAMAGDESIEAVDGAVPGGQDELAAEILEFWEAARPSAGLGKLGVVIGTGVAESVPPPAWSFGDNPALADSLLEAVLSGAKTSTSSSLWEYDDQTPVPEKGELSILLDGEGHPRALIRTTAVDIVPFGEVDEAFAAAEGEDDGSLEAWREGHRRYFERVLDREVGEDMPVVCEWFELRYPR
ncbi:ASCH domain-containing protein [Cellulosimicrobium marinum]|uniref:ASCH domain-containing protein n=1 Tax=Cellulosimicrobium marinum TaxID=1638992 RepID=UPI001E3F9621|nr:ASCH domain-containing protein [Cellulosimicrobium marinum]MCB7137878.1 ASCH domain-containing protein [Cellulosimicrobium marinum]